MNKVWDYIVNKMPGELIVSLIIMLVIAIFAIVLGHAIKKADPTKASKGLAFIADFIVDFSYSTIRQNLGNVYDFVVPYFIFLIFYVPMAFMSGLLGLASPMTYFTIPLCLAFVSWVGIQISAIKYQKLDYLKSFTDPLPPWLPVFIPINILSKLSPLLSLSIRMFGNALAGSILMLLVYWGTGLLSSAVFSFITSSSFNVFGVIIAPVLHAYFDVFGSFIQTLIFVLLSMLLIAKEIPAPVNREIKIKQVK